MGYADTLDPEANWRRLDGLKGTMRVERDPSLGYYRVRLGPIKLFWKTVGGWELTFVDEDEKVGVTVLNLSREKHELLR